MTEAIEAINYFAQSDGNNAWARDHIYGIEKDYRLARVAKISLFMNGAGEGNIIFGDGLENVPDKGIENGTFDILVANPPYAVKDFKQHLQLKNNSFTLLDRIGMNGGEIETLFVERIAQLLKPQGVASVILPSSILSNDSASYTGAREQLLQNFYIRGIAAFGSKTFGATGTNTVVMFLEKFNEPPKQIDLSADSVDAVFSGAELAEWKDKDIFEAYLAQIDVSENEYRAFLNKFLSVADLEGSKYFKMYVTAFADSADAKNLLKTKAYQQKSADEQAAVYLEKLYSYAYSIEREKLFYFSLVYQQTTVIITAPADNKAQKEFLGYDWSNRKGNEGIQIITPGGKMYNPRDRRSETALASVVRNSFMERPLSVDENLKKYASVVCTHEMLNFCRPIFTKAINITTAQRNSVISKYPRYRLDNKEKFSITIGKRVLSTEINQGEGIPVFSANVHGDFKHNNFVLKEEDYLNYSDNFKLIETLVKSIFSTNTVVFIGYSLNDYNIKLILNWTKTLLKDSFREPIFLYVGSQALTDTEIIYHQSKGLLVIEWNKLIASTDVYLDRYTAIFSALKNQSELSLDGKSEDDAFEILYNLLQPLGCLNALRIEDVSKRLYPYVIIGDDGVIRLSNNDSLLLKKFFTINQLSEGEQDNLTKTMLEKYRCILDVFRKARILEVEDGHKYRRFVAGEVPFADKNCILFDYSAMCTFSTKNYKTLERNYKKAFYLSRLRRYDEAFFHFSEVAKQAFKESNYLMYYFAESNCISLRKVIKNVNTWYRCYNLDAIEALSPNDLEAENLFRRLPVEFRNTYDNLRDIHSANMLYKYSYEAFADGQKLQKVIESGTTEFGMTSSGKAICRVNDYLHFLLGNGIVADVFSEYRNAVKNLMSLLVYKYSIQGKKVLHEQLFPFIGGNDVHFDEIDFHCFIEYFDAKEISALLKKHHIETIAFQNMDLVETAVNNLLDYYSSAVRATKNNIDVIGLQTQIKKCLVLLGYVNISQGLVDKICSFILTQEFREILIDDKILFLDRQLERRKMYSKETSRIVENTLISYLDRNISALKSGERFEVLSRNTGINYCNLVHYIFAPGEKHFSRRLAARVSQIINNNLFQMNRQITQHYYGYVSNNQQKKLITWANKQSRTNFSFDLFEMLVQCDARISKAAKTQLKIFLRQRIDAAQENNNNGIVVYPTKHPYEELDQVGYWCLINVLDAKDFREFLGNSAAFDFYCEYTKFDFNKFDVSWLLNLYPHTLEQIAKNEKVKGCVRVAIADALNDGEIALSDSQRLQSILIKHFC